MNSSNYINVARQSGLLKELNTIANNMANISTTGYRREGAVFSEFINAQDKGVHPDSPHALQDSTSIGHLGAHYTDFSTGAMSMTGGSLDVAIDGEGFFSVETPGGQMLTRAGSFLTDKNGVLMTPTGYPVLDDAGSKIQIPAGAGAVTIGGDGTISADGNPIGKLGILTADDTQLSRLGENLWRAEGGGVAVENPRVQQGFLEGSNVNPIHEIARMIEVQRSYEAGQKLLDIEDDRVAKTITAISQM